MKRTYSVILILALLLMAAQGVSAQTNGVLECQGAKLYYVFAGGNITGEGNPHPGIQRNYTCEVKPGTEIRFKFTGEGRISPQTGKPQNVLFRIQERAIVKYKVTQGNQQGILAKAFDNYGTYERRELKKGNNVTIALTQGNVSYALDKKTKIAKRTQDADLNFLDLNAPIMKKLNLQKKGSATVIGKKCTLYTGQNVEYYVWKGLVMKKVQHNSNGTTTISEVTSIEEPTTVDPKLFKLPDGYTVK